MSDEKTGLANTLMQLDERQEKLKAEIAHRTMLYRAVSNKVAYLDDQFEFILTSRVDEDFFRLSGGQSGTLVETSNVTRQDTKDIDGSIVVNDDQSLGKGLSKLLIWLFSLSITLLLIFYFLGLYRRKKLTY